MPFRVEFVLDAEQDLDALCAFLAAHDSHDAALAVLDRILKVCAALAATPHRGHFPPELERLGIRAYREVHMGPWRVLYEVRGETVSIHAVLNGRRNLQDILLERLIR